MTSVGVKSMFMSTGSPPLILTSTTFDYWKGCLKPYPRRQHQLQYRDIVEAILLTIVSITLGLIGVGIIAWLLSCFVMPLLQDTKAFAERVRFRQKQRILEDADSRIGKNEYHEALSQLVLAFFYDSVRTDKELIEKVHNHHVGILSRMVLVADKLSRRVDNLPIIEDLVLSRSELLRALFDARQSRATLSARRTRETPQWALDEYSKKIDELVDRLTTNQRSLMSQMQAAISDSKRVQHEQEITFH